MDRPLAPCPRCSRHVRVDEARCPFCGAATPTDFARHAVPGTTRRLSRAATFMFGAALTASGCGATVTGDAGPPPDATPDATHDTGGARDVVDDDGTPVVLYGVPADTGAADTGVADTGSSVVLYGVPADTGVADTGSIMGAYGVPPWDSGTPDAGAEDTGTVLPPYGVPPPPDGG